MSGRFPLWAGTTAGILILCVTGLIAAGGQADTVASETVAKKPGEIFRLTLRTSGKTEVLGTWTREELLKLKQVTSYEKDPGGQDGKWQGVRVTDLIDPILQQSSAAKSAEVDLLVFKNLQGAQTILPRSFVNKYPILLALKRNSKDLEGRGPIYSVVPKSESKAVRQELLPVESYFVSGLSEIELGNYRQQFPNVFLKQRSDPKRMRGERLFVKTCMGCHGTNEWPAPERASKRILSSVGGQLVPHSHSKMIGVPALSEKDQVGLESYFKAMQGENPDLASGDRLAKDKT